jgi:hypothetical protein
MMAQSVNRPGRVARRSRSPNERVLVPRLSLHARAEGDDMKPSPRSPLSPRAALSPSAVPTVKISPRFGTPRDENMPDLNRQSLNISGADGAKRRGSTLSARGVSTGARTARAVLGGASGTPNVRGAHRPNPLLAGSPPVRSSSSNSHRRHTSSQDAFNNSRTDLNSSVLSPASRQLQQISHTASASTRLSAASSSSGDSKSSDYFSGPSLAGETTAFAARSPSSLTPWGSTTSLHVQPAPVLSQSSSRVQQPSPYHGHSSTVQYSGQDGSELQRRNSAYSVDFQNTSLRSLAEGSLYPGGAGFVGSSQPLFSNGLRHARSSMAASSIATEDFPVADAEGDSGLFVGSASEQVEALCDKAQRIVRQLSACVAPPQSWEGTPAQLNGSSLRPLSARSSPHPGRGVNHQALSPATPQQLSARGPMSPGDSRLSPNMVGYEAVGNRAYDSCLAMQDVTELCSRVSRIEMVLDKERQGFLQQPSEDVSALRNQLHSVEMELVEVRGEMREARAQMAEMLKMLRQHSVAVPIGSSSGPPCIIEPRTVLSPRPRTHGGGDFVRPLDTSRKEGQVVVPITTAAACAASSSPRKIANRPPIVPSNGMPSAAIPVRVDHPVQISSPYAPSSIRIVTAQSPVPVMAGTPPQTVRVHTTPVQSGSTGLVTVQASSSASWRTVPWAGTLK